MFRRRDASFARKERRFCSRACGEFLQRMREVCSIRDDAAENLAKQDCKKSRILQSNFARFGEGAIGCLPLSGVHIRFDLLSGLLEHKR